MSELSGDQGARSLSSRFRILYLIIGIWFALYVIRLWQLQILSGHELRQFSEKNLLKESRVPAPRGLIYDRNGEVLVENLPGFEVTITPQYVEDLDSMAETISPIVGIPKKKIIKTVRASKRRSGPFYPARIKENLSRDEVFRLKQLRLDYSGLDIAEIILRSYPLGENGAHLFGYVGEISRKELPKRNANDSFLYRQGDIVGKSGIELSFEEFLRGAAGISFTQVDARGRRTTEQSLTILGQSIHDEPAIPGHDLTLTIDKDIQAAAYQAFEEKDRIGAIVATNPSGEVLAWVSRPAFDPNVFSRGFTSEVWKKLINDPDKPLLNKVIQDHNSPGSTFKPLVALAALEEKIISNPSARQYSPGFIKFGRRVYHDHARGGHGNINMYEAIERSSNVFFYKLGIELGIDKMHSYVSRLGIGKRTGVELEGEVPGLMPNIEWKLQHRGEPWQPGENLIAAIGQGAVLTTPLQMVSAYTAIGNLGQLFKPFVVKKVTSHDGEVLFKQAPQLVRDLSVKDDGGIAIGKKSFEEIKKGLWKVGNGDRGTARYWKIPGVEISGKSGTTQVMGLSADKLFEKCDKRPRHQRHHAWFVGYAPAEKPEITVAVLAEHSCSGSGAGAPVVRDVIKSYFQKYHPEIIKAGLEEQKRKWRAAYRKKQAEKKAQERAQAQTTEAQGENDVTREDTENEN